MSEGRLSAAALERFQSEEWLVERVSRQVHRCLGAAIPLDELMGWARVGLYEAAARFEPERGVPFRVFANYRVKGAIVDALRKSGGLPRRVYQALRAYEAGFRVSEGRAEDGLGAAPGADAPAEVAEALSNHLAAMATAMAVGLLGESAFEEDGTPTLLASSSDPSQLLEEASLRVALREAIEELPPIEAKLVVRHFLEGERLDQVGAELGLSKSWASRMLTRAEERLSRRQRHLR